MGMYIYTAINKSGRQIKGSMEGTDLARVENQLRLQGLVPIKVKEQGLLNQDIDIHFGPKVKPREMSVFCRQMVSLLKAGVSLVEALDMLAEQTENKIFAKAIAETSREIQKGENLAAAMARQPDIFPALMVSMVEAGEASGALEKVFARQAMQLEKSNRLMGTVKKAMIYPIAVLIVAVAVVIVMLTFVVPNFMTMFDDMDVEMPKITLMVIAMSNFMQSYWYIVLVVVAALIVGLRYYAKTPSGRLVFGTISLKLPIFGKLVVKSACASFARTLSTLLGSGLPVMDALEIAAHTLKNVHFQDAVEKAGEEVAKGVPLTNPIKKSGYFPPMICHMIRIGEETGNMEDMLDKAAEYYEEEVELATQSLTTALEPMIIVILALLVGGIIGAVMAPMLTMYQSLGNL